MYGLCASTARATSADGTSATQEHVPSSGTFPRTYLGENVLTLGQVTPTLGTRVYPWTRQVHLEEFTHLCGGRPCRRHRGRPFFRGPAAATSGQERHRLRVGHPLAAAAGTPEVSSGQGRPQGTAASETPRFPPPQQQRMGCRLHPAASVEERPAPPARAA